MLSVCDTAATFIRQCAFDDPYFKLYDAESCAEAFILTMREFIYKKSTSEEFKVNSYDFTRDRSLTFPRTVIGALHGSKMPLQERMDRFFKELGEDDVGVSASAFSQARQKFSFKAFCAMNGLATGMYYRFYPQDGLVRTWGGRRLLAVDGSVVNLHNTVETRQHFSVVNGTVQALSSYSFDVLNDVIVSASLGRLQAEKNFIFECHRFFWDPNDIVIYDMAYADYSVIAWHVSEAIDIIVRCPLTTSFKAVTDFVNSPALETIVTIKVPDRQRSFVTEHQLPSEVTVRLVKVFLPNDTTEVLLTTLLDPAQYPREMFAMVYHQRWCIETCIGQLKHVLDIERFSSPKVSSILQDFYGLVLLATFTSILTKETDHALRKRHRQRPRKYLYQVNAQVSTHATVMYLVQLLLATSISAAKLIQKLQTMFARATVPIRPGRSYPRVQQSPRQQLRYHKYERRIWT